MDVPNHADQPPPVAIAPASSSPTSGYDVTVGTTPYQDHTQLLTKLFVGTTLTVPTDDAPNHINDHTPPLVSPAPGKAPLATPAAPPPNTFSLPIAVLAAFPMVAGNNPGTASRHDAIIDLLAKLVGDGEPTTSYFNMESLKYSNIEYTTHSEQAGA
ncbi:unnamed protein product [Urochloa humidicola]